MYCDVCGDKAVLRFIVRYEQTHEDEEPDENLELCYNCVMDYSREIKLKQYNGSNMGFDIYEL